MKSEKVCSTDVYCAKYKNIAAISEVPEEGQRLNLPFQVGIIILW
jgi:hypothetical protein